MRTWRRPRCARNATPRPWSHLSFMPRPVTPHLSRPFLRKSRRDALEISRTIAPHARDCVLDVKTPLQRRSAEYAKFSHQRRNLKTHMASIQQLLDIMATLRDPERGCPWDREQSFATVAPHTIEEAYEVADAIARGDMNELRDELGDLLFQVVFYAQMAKEAGQFDFATVVAAICEKITRRHPHVFGEARVRDAAEQSEQWERHKAAERVAKAGDGPHSVFDGVSRTLPALTRAVKLQRRAARVGFDWENLEQVLAKLEEEIAELRAEMASGSDPARMRHEIGDLLLVCSNIARYADVDPESALREANGRFERRFRRIEERLAEQGRTPAQATLAEMEKLWQQAKREEGHAAGEAHPPKARASEHRKKKQNKGNRQSGRRIYA